MTVRALFATQPYTEDRKAGARTARAQAAQIRRREDYLKGHWPHGCRQVRAPRTPDSTGVAHTGRGV